MAVRERSESSGSNKKEFRIDGGRLVATWPSDIKGNKYEEIEGNLVYVSDFDDQVPGYDAFRALLIVLEDEGERYHIRGKAGTTAGTMIAAALKHVNHGDRVTLGVWAGDNEKISLASLKVQNPETGTFAKPAGTESTAGWTAEQKFKFCVDVFSNHPAWQKHEPPKPKDKGGSGSYSAEEEFWSEAIQTWKLPSYAQASAEWDAVFQWIFGNPNITKAGLDAGAYAFLNERLPRMGDLTDKPGHPMHTLAQAAAYDPFADS